MKTKNIYISVPWRDINSRLQAFQICKKTLEMGHNPICWTVMYAQLLDFADVNEREKAVQHTTKLLPVCDEIWTFGTFKTPSMIKELEEAARHGLPVVEHSILDFLCGAR